MLTATGIARFGKKTVTLKSTGLIVRMHRRRDRRRRVEVAASPVRQTLQNVNASQRSKLWPNRKRQARNRPTWFR